MYFIIKEKVPFYAEGVFEIAVIFLSHRKGRLHEI